VRRFWSVLIVGVCLAGSTVASGGQLAAVDFAKAAVPRALNYEQGNRGSLIDAQDDFTPEAWSEFMKRLQGYVDDKGAPSGSSVFVASGEAVVKREQAGVIRLAIPGALKQQSRNAAGGLSTTTYRVRVDIEVAGTPLKIQHLRTTTCGAKPCAD
jgi:hypothetical protein